MAGPAKNVTDTDHAGGAAREIHLESRSGASESMHLRVQLSTSTLDAGASHDEVRSGEGPRRCKEDSILLVRNIVLPIAVPNERFEARKAPTTGLASANTPVRLAGLQRLASPGDYPAESHRGQNRDSAGPRPCAPPS